MKINKDSSCPPFKFSSVIRPWGCYGLYSENEKCTTKILYINKDQLLSMQYHFKRSQYYLVLDDGFIIEYSDEPVPKSILNNPKEPDRFHELEAFLKEHLISVQAKEGDMFGFLHFIVHRATYNGDRDVGRILDVAFGENDEEDIVRIKDAYGR